MERTITSHSGRAVAIEMGKQSNELANLASQSAFLLQILSDGKSRDDVPGLMKTGRKFAKEALKASRLGSRNYRSLIPMRVLLGGFGGDDAERRKQARSLAEELQRALDARSSTGDFTDLARRLDEFSERLSQHAWEMGRATLGG